VEVGPASRKTHKPDDIIKKLIPEKELFEEVFSSEKEAVKRLSGRRICEKCGEVYNVITNPPKESGKCDKCKGKLIQRDDDRPEAIKVRFRYYRNNTKKLIDYLDNKEKLIRVDAVRPINVIYLEILEKLGVKNG